MRKMPHSSLSHMHTKRSFDSHYSVFFHTLPVPRSAVGGVIDYPDLPRTEGIPGN